MARSGITVVHVSHTSPVTAVQTAGGAARLLEEGVAERLGAGGLGVEVVEVPGPRKPVLGAVAELFATADAVARVVDQATGKDRLAVVLAASCQMGLGAAAGLPPRERGLVWLDAHGDFHTPATTTSGLLDGTVLATLTGRCWHGLAAGVTGFAPFPDDRVALVGVRAPDPEERDALAGSRLTIVPPTTLRTLIPTALRALGQGTDHVYLHVDLDVLDAREGKANDWAVEGGLSAAELRWVVDEALRWCPVDAVGFTAYDPAADPQGRVVPVTLKMAEAVGRWAAAA